MMHGLDLDNRLSRSRFVRGVGLCLLAVMLAGGLAACGKKSPPKPPSGDEAPYPRSYPSE